MIKNDMIELKDEQLSIAINALHVIAVIDDLEPNFAIELALDALREMETYGYLYENYYEENL